MAYEIQNWELIDYADSVKKQESLLEEIKEKNKPGVIVFCTHPPVVTLGRGTQAGDVFSWQGPLIEISRGGRATYHGPSQVVVYPIINLNFASDKRAAKDVGVFLRNLEQCIVNSLKTYGIESQGRSLQQKNGEEVPAEETGVWVGRQKIASLGIAVRKWITYHGAAINLDEDPQAFQGLRPCGFTKETMTSIEKILGHKVNRTEYINQLTNQLQKLL